MRIYFIVFLLHLLIVSHAQECKQLFSTQQIAEAEASAHSRLFQSNQYAVGDVSFDVKHYSCHWKVDPALRFIEGNVVMTYQMKSASNQIQLDLSSVLHTDSIVQHGQRLNFNHQNDVITIQWPLTQSSKTIDSLIIYYKGIPPSTGFGSFILAQHGLGIPVMWTLSEPYGARDWWPCKNGLDDKTDSIDIYITHPGSYKSTSNGLLVSENSHPDGTVTTHWHHSYPIATYLICMAVTDYVTFTRYVNLNGNLLPLVTYCYPESQTYFEQGTGYTLEAMDLFHRTVGDYPFIREKYGHVQFGWGGGMEHQTSTFIVNVDEGLTAHELAHQWFGDLVTCKSWKDIWLNEGFATFMARYFSEKKYPEQAANRRQSYINNITSKPDGSVRVDDTTNVWRIFDGRLSYDKGSFLLEMLRVHLGDDVFFAAIRAYLNDVQLRYSFVTTENLKQHLERKSGKNLDNFFEEWYAGQGFPSFKAEWEAFGSGLVKTKISQTTSHASVSFFHLTLPILYKKGAQEKLILHELSDTGQIFTDNPGFTPDTVIIDPEYRIISANNTSQKIVFTTSGTAGAEVYPNPVGQEITNLFLHDFNEDKADIILFNTQGQRLNHWSLPLFNGKNIMKLDLSNYCSGVYFLRVHTAEKNLTKKIIK